MCTMNSILENHKTKIIMDPHERFIALSAQPMLCLLYDAEADVAYCSRIAKLIIEGLSERHGADNPQDFEMIRGILCALYQQKFSEGTLGVIVHNDQPAARYEETLNISSQLLLCHNTLEDMDGVYVSLIFDVVALWMLLYSNESDVWKYLTELLRMMHVKLINKDPMKLSQMQTINCYLNVLLCFQRTGIHLLPEYVELDEALLGNVRLWLKLVDHKRYEVLTQLVPKYLKVVDSSNMVSEIWETILLEIKDVSTALSMLCVNTDLWFTGEFTKSNIMLSRVVEEPFWLLLNRGLCSSVPQQRKQALYLTKRVVEYAKEHKVKISQLGNYKEIRPLICYGDYTRYPVFKQHLEHFFLILELLEEKQKHLVMPVFPLLKTLQAKVALQETDFDIRWLRCVFTRILQHDNNAIVKEGLLNVFKLHPVLYDNDLLTIVLGVLNNTYLYERELTEKEPIIVEELTKLLNYADMKNTDLVTRFMVKSTEITWGPVALFYFIHALSMVEKVNSTWKEDQLAAVKVLAELNLTMHCRILRIGSQIELLNCLTYFATDFLDLVAVTDTLSVFPTSEALIRGYLSWKHVSAWIAKIVNTDKALCFLDNICTKLSSENSKKDFSMKSLSLIIMLFHDGGLLFDTKSCAGLGVLHNLLHCLKGADSRPYANAELRYSTIELISHLLELTTPKDYILRELISDYAELALRLTFKSLRKISSEAELDNVNTYALVTQQIFLAENSVITKRELLKYLDKFEVESCNIIDDGALSNNVQRFFGIKILYTCLKKTSPKSRNYKFIEPLCSTYKTLTTQSFGDSDVGNKTCAESKNLKGKIAAEYYKFVAELFHEYVTDQPPCDWIPGVDWIEQVSYLIQIGGKDILLPAARMLTQVFYKGAVNEINISNFKSTTRLCWKFTLESNECRSATEQLVDLMFSSVFLECQETRELTMECTREIVDKLDKNPRLSIILLNRLKQGKGDYLSSFSEAIVACLLHGAVPRRDQKIEIQARSYLLHYYQELYPNYLCNMYVDTNAAIRAHAVVLLHKMVTDFPTHAVQLLPLIVAKLQESQNKRYFGDSQMHRFKNRLMQVLLILQPVLQIEDVASLHKLMCENLLSESSQPSVRIMQEWILIRIYLGNESLRASIWHLFDQAQEKRVGSLCSVISIVYHVARLIPSDQQAAFINLALQHIMPCCMAQQFNVRLYSQVIASKLYDLAADLSYSTITEKYRELYNALSKSLKHGNLMKNSIKLQDDFYFTVFHPVNDYSLQTLYHELPRLSNVSSDEYILPHVLEEFGFKESNSHPLKLLNPKNDLNKARISDHMMQSSGSAGPIADEINNSAHCTIDIQKKFIPWKSMVPDGDELWNVSEAVASRREVVSKGNNIILVASLVEKLPNLGGLSRTCEIFGVKELVISCIKHTEDKEFQSLSVSAEKFIPLVEVKPHQIQQYLSEKKEMGYRLVGAEQTVNSTNLMDVKFDKATVLLLGNEKAGIPANLIPLLDECVEIPQVGVVRSLNVHVTGAICLWEYFKQHNSV